MVTFRVGAGDALLFEKEFAPFFTADDIVNLGVRQIYLRLSIDGVGSKPFSAHTMPPINLPDDYINHVPLAISFSRAVYGKEKSLAEEEIRNWYKPILATQINSSSNTNIKQDTPSYASNGGERKDARDGRRDFRDSGRDNLNTRDNRSASNSSNNSNNRSNDRITEPRLDRTERKDDRRDAGRREDGRVERIDQRRDDRRDERSGQIKDDTNLDKKYLEEKNASFAQKRLEEKKENNNLRDAINSALKVKQDTIKPEVDKVKPKQIKEVPLSELKKLIDIED
jgi:hypothetical protein